MVVCCSMAALSDVRVGRQVLQLGLWLALLPGVAAFDCRLG
jgi:hypothetical protein